MHRRSDVPPDIAILQRQYKAANNFLAGARNRQNSLPSDASPASRTNSRKEVSRATNAVRQANERLSRAKARS
jgi:hypothetical protein